jgi:hypothetical protein
MIADQFNQIALFSDIDQVAEALDQLRESGIADDKMDVISGIPFSHEILGRPQINTVVPKLAAGGAIVGWFVAMFLIFGIPYLYSLLVGGQPIFPMPPFYIVAFEMTMLGLMGTAFIALFLASNFPSYTPKIYVPEVSDGKIAIAYTVPEEKTNDVAEMLNKLGAESVTPAERRNL